MWGPDKKERRGRRKRTGRRVTKVVQPGRIGYQDSSVERHSRKAVSKERQGRMKTVLGSTLIVTLETTRQSQLDSSQLGRPLTA